MAPTKLTPKQQEVHGLLKSETDPKEIAETLKVSKAAVYSHIRAIKEAGHAIPARYANVGVGRGGGRKPAKATTKRRARKSVGGVVATNANGVSPVAAPGVNVKDVFAGLPVNVKDVFAGLREQIARDVANIEVRRQEIAASITALNEQITTLHSEDGDLEMALARLHSTEAAVSADPGPRITQSSANGDASPVQLTGAAA